MTAIKAILFDHDGTLADSEVVHFQFWQAVLKDLNVVFNEDDYRLHFAGVSELHTAVALRERFQLQPPVIELVAAKRAQAKRFHASQHYPLMDGVVQTLQVLKAANIRMAVVSGTARFALDANLTGVGLLPYFECIASGEEVAQNKPAPDVYLHALASMGLQAQDCIAVEDTASGLQAARAAGIVTCVIPNAYSAHHDFSGAANTATSMTDFLRWLKAYSPQFFLKVSP